MSNFALGALRSRRINAEVKAQGALASIGGSLPGLAKKLAKIAGFLLGKVVSFFNLDFTDIWDMIVESYFELKTFDWNATDAELNKQIERNNQVIAVSAAEALGEILPYGAVRLANFFIGRFIGKFSRRGKAAQHGIKVPVLSARIDLALAEEGAEEARFAVRSFIRRAGRAQLNNQFIAYVLKARQNEWLGQQSITEPREDGSIYAKIQRRIQKLPKFWQEPVEEFIESFEDALTEVGYVVSFEIADHIAAARYAAQQQVEQPARVVEVLPRDGSGPIVWAGPQDEVQQAITTIEPIAAQLKGGDLAVPEVWSLKPGAYVPQLAIVLRTDDNKKAGILNIPHYTGQRSPSIPSFTHGSYCTQWKFKDNSKIMVYTSTEREGQKLARAMGRYVDAFWKIGQPITQTSNRRVKEKHVKPVIARYYPSGAGGDSEWVHYF